MKRPVLTLLCLSGLALLPVTVRAQSLYGPGGLFLHPTADLPPKGQLTAGVLVLPQRIPFTPGLHKNPTWGSVSLDYGLTEEIEIGATSLMITDFSPSFGGFFKYRFLPEGDRRPAVAIGFTDSEHGDNNGRAAFLALRKQLNSDADRPIVGHVGALYIDTLAGFPYEELQPYGGVEWWLDQRWALIGEARPRGRSDLKVSTALSLSYQYGKGNRLVVTWANTGQSTQSRLGFGIGYTIGTRR